MRTVYVSTINIFSKISLRDTLYITYIIFTTCFGTKVPSSGSSYNMGVRANLLIYVLIIVMRLIKIVFKLSILCISYILCTGILTINVLIKLIIMNKI
jgi:hypothetical protein